MNISQLTTADITKLISLLSEEIAALSVRLKIYPDKAPELGEEIRKNESIIEKLERMS